MTTELWFEPRHCSPTTDPAAVHALCVQGLYTECITNVPIVVATVRGELAGPVPFSFTAATLMLYRVNGWSPPSSNLPLSVIVDTSENFSSSPTGL